MSWKNSVDSAIQELKNEEKTLQQEINTVQKIIGELTQLLQSSKPGGRAPAAASKRPKRPKRRLSAAGREAISKAAKKRWAKFHAANKAKDKK